MLTLSLAQLLLAPPALVYRAVTVDWHPWLADATSLQLRADAGAPFYFEGFGHDAAEGTAPTVTHRMPHYGRFLALIPDQLVAMTWVSGPDGTAGHETVVTIQLEAHGRATRLSLTHEGFATETAREQHRRRWEDALARLVEALPRMAMSPPAANRSMPDATLVPTRSYPDLDAAVSWLTEALGCAERLRVPEERIQLTIGNGALVAVAWKPDQSPASGGRPPATLLVRTDDVNARYARAIALGAEGITPPQEQPWGERQAVIRDPFGHSWTLSETVQDVDPATWGAVVG